MSGNKPVRYESPRPADQDQGSFAEYLKTIGMSDVDYAKLVASQEGTRAMAGDNKKMQENAAAMAARLGEIKTGYTTWTTSKTANQSYLDAKTGLLATKGRSANLLSNPIQKMGSLLGKTVL